MTLSLLTAAAVLLLLGPSFLRMELSSVLGPVHASGADERISVKVLVPLLLSLTLIFSVLRPAGAPDGLYAALSHSDLLRLLALAIGTAAAVLLSSVLHGRAAVSYALVGAILGGSFLDAGQLDLRVAGGIVASWLLAPLVCGALTAILTRAFIRRTSRSGTHLALMDRQLLAGCILGSLLLVAAFGWNEMQLFSLLPAAAVAVQPEAVLVCVGGMWLLYAMFSRTIRARVYAMRETELDFGTGHTMAILFSMAATFALFSWPRFLPAPLSAGSLLMSALAAVGLVRGKASVSGGEILRHAAAAVLAPLLAFLLSYCFCLILTSGPAGRGSASLTPLLVLLGLVALGVVLYLYRRAMRQEALHAQYLRSREEEAAATQKTLAALKLRVETNEKDLLNKLEIKRKELTDFAMGVNEQKAFMEKVYEDLSRLKDLPDGADKDRMLDEILVQLREHRYFNREISDFYARMEVLHRDFNMRLREMYPDLTESERRLTNLLRQGFSSKYIASLMNIAPKSVEIGRYRLRAKLGLDRSVNLVQFIKSI